MERERGRGRGIETTREKRGLECPRRARLGPSGNGRPSVAGRREGLGCSGSRTRARIEGRGGANHVWTQSRN